MPINLPSISELGQMEFMAPLAFQQAQLQTGLANQFAQGQLSQQQQDITSSILKNLFDAQYNPKRLEELQTKNAAAALKFSQDQELDPYTRAVGKSEALNKLDENDTKRIMQQIERDLVSDDPVKRANATEKLLQTAAMQKIKLQNDAKTEAARLAAESRLRGIEMREAGATERNAANVEQRRAAAEARLAAANAKNGNKPMNFEQQLGDAQRRWNAASSPEERAAIEDEMRVIQGWMINKATAGQAGKIDVGAATGMPVNPQAAPVVPNPSRPMPAQVVNPQGLPAFSTNAAGHAAVNPAAQAAMDKDRTAIFQQEYLRILNSPDYPNKSADLASLTREMQRANVAIPQASGQPSPQKAPAAPAIKAPAGRVVIYKDGKPVGSVPESQAELAKQQGYTLQ